MRENSAEIIKKLVSSLQGAPYPASIENELYTIWYEHAQIAAQEGLEYVDAAEHHSHGGSTPTEGSDLLPKDEKAPPKPAKGGRRSGLA
jgi:hypothetical protein